VHPEDKVKYIDAVFLFIYVYIGDAVTAEKLT
jgi:hypothetical protein